MKVFAKVVILAVLFATFIAVIKAATFEDKINNLLHHVEEEFDALADSTSFESHSLTVDLKESNEWWVQLKVTPSAKSVTVQWEGHSVEATSPSWDSSNQYFTAKIHDPLKINRGTPVKFIVHKLNGGTVEFTRSWLENNSGGGSSSGGGDSGKLPGQEPGKKVYEGYATWYDAHAAGTPVCRTNPKYCGAPSDMTVGLGNIGPCGKGKGTCQNCLRGYCDSPGCTPPQCGKAGCGRKIKIWCIDSQGCKTNQPIVMTVNSFCPSKHPCNTCKGSENPCARKDHIDLCQATFDAIANYQPSAKGLKIAYQPL
ncbi:hypothetical protein ABK040_003923 [Willaertia magna]